MTTARALLASSLIIALALVFGAWWTSRPQPTDRFQLVNVGGGETQRMDKATGAILSCRDGACRPIDKNSKPAADPWAEFPKAK